MNLSQITTTQIGVIVVVLQLQQRPLRFIFDSETPYRKGCATSLAN